VLDGQNVLDDDFRQLRLKSPQFLLGFEGHLFGSHGSAT
jgi:hypothetical protein